MPKLWTVIPFFLLAVLANAVIILALELFSPGITDRASSAWGVLIGGVTGLGAVYLWFRYG